MSSNSDKGGGLYQLSFTEEEYKKEREAEDLEAQARFLNKYGGIVFCDPCRVVWYMFYIRSLNRR
jgi:hypothetical protein